MKKRLRQLGNSWGFVIPKPFLELLEINPMLDEVEFKLVDDELRIKKAKIDEHK